RAPRAIGGLGSVAALGHAHGPNTERGVYRSRDGGKTWKRVLYRNERAGAVDLSIDANNPRIIYATIWEAIRRPWELVSGGPGSGIFRSNDGGDTWTELTRAKGLPKGVLGKIGISASAARGGRVYAIVESDQGGVYRSDDFGDTWTRGSEDRNLRQRAWYYDHIYADPKDPETVWVLNVDAWRSSDGGKTFEQMSIPHGDNHDMWIDPNDPLRIIEGNDGGAVVTFNGGETWTGVYNQPTAEFYHVITDEQTPYRIYGAQQDNTTITIPSRAPIAGITGADTFAIGGGESGYIAIRPDDPNVIFAGNYQGIITRYDRRTGQSRNIMVWPESSAGEGAIDVKHRFQWTCPIVLSPHDPNVLYHAGNRVFRSRDEGASWEAISPDLTRNDPSKLGASGGPVTKDNTGAEYYCTIFAFVESPVQRGLFWAGSDDGLVHVSRDDGRTWKNVTPPGVRAWSLVSIIEASPHDAGTAYVATT
ncbi:MAG: glycosyl hydrolase, partial [Chloroflexota bacterium]